MKELDHIFFVVGVPKSGTSWLMRLLDSHPEIICKGEAVFYGESTRSLQRILAGSEDVRRWIETSPWTHGPRDPKLDEIVGMLARSLMLRKLERSRTHFPSKRIVGNKAPFRHYATVSDLLDNVPGARLVHIIRDGRDQAISRIHHRWNRGTGRSSPIVLSPAEIAKRERYRKDPESFGKEGESIFADGMAEESAREWAHLVADARQQGVLYPGRYTEVRYEDLLLAPVAEFRRILGFLGADDSEATAADCVEHNSFERLAGRERGQEDVASFYRKGVAGDWRKVFTLADREAYQREAGDLLAELGYESDPASDHGSESA